MEFSLIQLVSLAPDRLTPQKLREINDDLGEL
jgi:hypothetical protein